jgi:AcrR family transcriptional regulator
MDDPDEDMEQAKTGTRERRRSRTKEAILEAALELLRRQGLEGIAVRELARRLDYSPAALYRYFQGRDQIIAALVTESARMLCERLQAVPDGRSRTDRLTALGEAYLTFAKDEPVRFRLLFLDLPSGRTSLDTPPAAASPYRIVLDAARAAIASHDVAEHLDPEAIAYTLWATVHGMAVLEQTHLRGFDADFDRVHRTSLELLVKSWMPERPKGGDRC